MPSGSSAPRWDLSSIYPGYDSNEYKADRAELAKVIGELKRKVDDPSTAKKDTAKWLKATIKRLDAAYGLYENLSAYLECAYAVSTTDSRTLNEINSLEEDALPLKDAIVRFRIIVRRLRKAVRKACAKSKSIERFSFFLNEQIELADHQMSVEAESLAADLERSGSDAWSRLQETVSSTLSWPWSGSEFRTVVQLRSMAMDPDRETRRKAFRKEIDALRSVEIPVAAALNGVKGFAVSLDRRRGYSNSLERAAEQSRISPRTLESQIASMEASLPVFRRYLKAKAKLLGIKTCAFYDLFAPVGNSNRTWTFDEARDFIVERFSAFALDLGDFAEHAFKERWIDGEPREGKVGGAFCAGMPLAGQSRILANFDGSFDALFTLAHELGHGYHGYVLRDLPVIHQDYPMTLAETASIFCETIVFNHAIQTDDAQERIAVLELFLQSATQVVVDILSRYKFEQAVFDRRAKAELSPSELCDLMIDAQKATYGDGLDPKNLHPYMWAVKSHYYSANRSFYNFPYAFGLLFGLGLYAGYEHDAHDFPARYRDLLRMTGQASANDVTRVAGFDIEREEFWQGGIGIIADRVDEFARLVDGETGSP